MVASAKTLSLADLEGFDPYAPQRDGERRFLCPFCGHSKPRDASHRSLNLNTQTGAWNCHRCGAAGKLLEFREERPLPPFRRDRRARDVLRRRFVLPPPRQEPTADDFRWRQQLQDVGPLPGTLGADYLARRSIPLDLAIAAGVRFHPAWYARPQEDWPGRPAVLFPVRNLSGRLVATQGRCVDNRTPKALTAGPVGRGVFATPGALQASPIVLVEAPIDALSLAVGDIPAVATLGTNLPDWLAWACALRPVLLATDADEAGDQAAEKWGALLRHRGATVSRWRPPDGAKDWNEWLQREG